MQTIVVLGSWSSGTTAVTGYVQRLGAYSCPPHWMTNDPRTRDSYESLELRHILTKCIDEVSLNPLIPDYADVFKDFMRRWFPAKQAEAKASGASAVVLKHPLTAFFLNEVTEICNPKYLLVTRGLQDIENTRMRRGWHATLGRQGAEIIYKVICGALMQNEKSFYAISFENFLHSEDERERMRDYLSVSCSDDDIARAESWIRYN